VDRDSGRLVANISLFEVDHDHGTAQIGYRVMPDRRRMGLGSEAVAAVTTWAFDNWRLESRTGSSPRGGKPHQPWLARIQLEHAIINPASCGVALRCGYDLEGTLRQAYRGLDGVRRDEHVHARLR
jgi:RimJ/RimL family protein N-acetyltransferase